MKSDCIYNFPIDLESSAMMFGSKTIKFYIERKTIPLYTYIDFTNIAHSYQARIPTGLRLGTSFTSEILRRGVA